MGGKYVKMVHTKYIPQNARCRASLGAIFLEKINDRMVSAALLKGKQQFCSAIGFSAKKTVRSTNATRPQKTADMRQQKVIMGATHPFGEIEKDRLRE